MSAKYDFDGLCAIMDTLISENGCPWDKVQTHQTLREDIIEESYEVVDAIDKNDMPGLCEELGDVLFSIVFHCKLAEKEGAFTTADMVGGIGEKMVRRHPHIFTDAVKADTPGQVVENWDQIKKVEKSYTTGSQTLRAVPEAMPALMRAEKVEKRAEKASAEKFGLERSMAKASAALARLADSDCSEEEKSAILGRLLFWIVAISRKLNINAEFALTNATETFINNFEDCENATKSTSEAFWDF